MDSGTISWVLTIVVCGALGWLLASRRPRPAGPLTYVALLVVTVGGYFIGVDTRLVDVGGFTVFLNWAIVSCSVGGCLGFLLRSRKLRRLENA